MTKFYFDGKSIFKEKKNISKFSTSKGIDKNNRGTQSLIQSASRKRHSLKLQYKYSSESLNLICFLNWFSRFSKDIDKTIYTFY